MRTSLLFVLFPLAVAASDFPTPYNSERDPASPMPASEAAARIKLPPGFKAKVFAAEPDIQNPIAMAWDARGRLWVAENYTYAERSKRFDLNLRDRIVILEDTDGDGHFDTRKVFTDELQMLTSIEVGRGGVWVMCPPQVLFIPDRNGDDVPDGAPEAVLDGFTVPTENYHNFANGLRFGPDGWLYGRCGASCPGEVGVPGTPAAERIPVRGTMWRFNTKTKTVEALSCGCTNPWGHDWNEHGELFFINTVNGHLWHQIQGAHFVRPHTIDPNPRTYSLIDMHADHWHFDTAQGWANQRDGKADSLGGGHAHIGMMVYLGDNWPAEYRGHLFTLNMHGRRANQEILERSGSGYVGKHGTDFFVSGDPWFRGMEVSYGPDGGVFVLDWSDTGECHESTGVHRTSGRIYKITYVGDEVTSPDHKRKPYRPSDLRKSSISELVSLHTHANEWFSRQARLELAARADAGSLGDAPQQLRKLYDSYGDVVVKLRALWSLYVIGAADESFLRAQLSHSNEHVRTWAVRLLTEDWPLDTLMSQRPPASKAEDRTSNASMLARFAEMAANDPSGLVRLTLASTLQRLPVDQRVQLATALVSHKEDAADHNLPLLIWYGLIAVADSDPSALVDIAAKCELPTTRTLIARRLAEDVEKNPAPLSQLLNLAGKSSEPFQEDVVTGLGEGLAGWAKAKKPTAWDAFAAKVTESADTAVRDRVRELSVVFGDGRALDAVRKTALDSHADLNIRKAALQTLIDSHAPDLQDICEHLLRQQFLNSVAARGLARFDDPSVGDSLVRAYRQFHYSERGQLLSVLVSRVSFAEALLDGVAEKRIAREDITPFHARQIHSLNNEKLNKRLAEVWGELRETEADKQKLIAKYKIQLAPGVLTKADRSQGRAVFNTACAPCHTLYGEGGKVGPDLTGSGRDNIDYLLENIVDPSAVVTADFRMSIIDLKDGRVLNGLIAAKTERTITLKTQTETLTIDRNEIESIRESSLSLMPEGLLDGLPPEQARDLIAYLMNKTQVSLPAAKLSAK